MNAKKDWRKEETGWVLGGCVEHEFGFNVTNFDSLVDAVGELIEKAAEEPDTALGLLACLVYHLGDVLVKVKAEHETLKKHYEHHQHVDAVVITD